MSLGVKAWMSVRPAPDFHQALFGVTSPSAVEAKIGRFCAEYVGAPVADITFYWVSTGAVAGVELEDGRQLACKFLPRDLERLDVLRACRRVQAHALECRLPVPAPVLGPIEWDAATVTVDSWLPSPPPRDASRAEIRTGLARLLYELIERLRGLDEPDLRASRYRLPERPPACGLAEFDVVAASAHAVLRSTQVEPVIGHVDWRSQNAHVDETGQAVAIYDWDAVTIDAEESFVGTAAAMLSVVFGAPQSSVPSPEHVAAFVAAYELARGASFSMEQRALIAAAVLYKLARHAIVETGLDPDETRIDHRSVRLALRTFGADAYRSAVLASP